MAIRAKYKNDRRLLQNTFGLEKSSFNRKKYRPGQFKKTSHSPGLHNQCLLAKQKLLAFYVNMSDTQLKTLFKKAVKKGSECEAFIIQNLETRLDTILFRSGVARTMHMARQMASHKHTLIAGRKPNACSYLARPSDTIKIDEKISAVARDSLSKMNRVIVPYIELQREELIIKVHYDRLPKSVKELNFATDIDFNLIIRYYRL